MVANLSSPKIGALLPLSREKLAKELPTLAESENIADQLNGLNGQSLLFNLSLNDQLTENGTFNLAILFEENSQTFTSVSNRFFSLLHAR